MEKLHEIKNLDKLLKLEENKKKLISYTTKPLTASGENYGSLMLAIEVTVETNKTTDTNSTKGTNNGKETNRRKDTNRIKDTNDKEEIKHPENTKEVMPMVAKLCPDNDFITKIFNIPMTFTKEYAFYHVIIPTLQAFQDEMRNRKSNINKCVDNIPKYADIFPKCYGSRLNLNQNYSNNSDDNNSIDNNSIDNNRIDNNVVDNNAVILLENLKTNGFTTIDTNEGFDLHTTNLILHDLAVFHTMPIAFKLKHPDIFKQKIMPYLQRNTGFENVSSETIVKMFNNIADTIRANDTSAHLADIAHFRLMESFKYYRNKQAPKEPYGTIMHHDNWINNLMVKFADNGKPIKNKMIDFQLIEYDSPANDFVFFLFSSVSKKIIDENYDNLLHLYHRTFIEVLEEMECDSNPFTLQLLQQEINEYAKCYQFFHVMIMLKPIHSVKGEVTNLDEMTEDDWSSMDHVTENYGERVAETALSFASRNWL